MSKIQDYLSGKKNEKKDAKVVAGQQARQVSLRFVVAFLDLDGFLAVGEQVRAQASWQVGPLLSFSKGQHVLLEMATHR